MVIYKEQAITDLAIPEQQAVVKNPLEDIATKMAETYDKEVKALNMEQDNNAKQSIQMAFETYKDDPVMFEQTVDKTIGGLSEKLRTPEDKVEFLAKAEMTKALYKNRAEINYRSKVDKQYQESYQADVDLGMASLKENLMLIHTGGKGASLVTAELGKLKTMVDKKDSKGNYLLTRTQRVKAMDLIDNAEFYGALSYAEYLKATDDNVNLDLEYEAYMKDVQGEFTPEQRTKILEAFKPSKDDVNTYEQVQTEVGFKTTIDYMNIKDGVINNPASNMAELFNVINDLDVAYANKMVSDSFYKSNMSKLKATWYKQEEDKLFKGKSVGSDLLKYVKNDVGVGDTVQEKEKRYDLLQYYYQKLKENGVDPESTIGTERIKANTIINKARGEWLLASIKYATEADVASSLGQNKLVAEENRRKAIKYAEELMGLSENFDEFIKENRLDLEDKYAPEYRPTLKREEYQEYVPNPNIGMF